MARDLSFWKEKNSSEKSAADTYKALLDGEELDYVCELPIENILEDVKNTFSDWEQLDALFMMRR